MSFIRLLFAAFIAAASAQPADKPTRPVSMEEVGSSPTFGTGAPATPSSPPPVESVYKSGSGIFPVYEINGEWTLIDRKSQGPKRQVKPGTLMLVVGSRATALFKVSRSLEISGAACSRTGPLRTPAYILTGRAKSWVGVPIIAISLRRRVRVDPRKAGFAPLPNYVNNETYSALGGTLQDKIIEDVRSGKFTVNSDDSLGRTYAQNPNPDNIHTNIDFASTIHMAGISTAQMLVTLSQLSKSSRRCLWLFLNDKLAGNCADMPHLLMAETSFLDFVSYDPNHDGHPFVLAYTTKEPLWGQERWGFYMSRRGPSVFLIDTLDPKCRERF